MISQKSRIRRARQQAHVLWIRLCETREQPDLAGSVRKRLRPDNCVWDDDDILVTELGFVTMAILPAYTQRVADALTVPGVDHLGARGYLVLMAERMPFHSLAETADEAVLDARGAHAKSDHIVAAFGSRAALRSAVNQAPWHTMSMPVDLANSGLCEWGANSFLQRFGLHTVAFRTGLPRALFRVAGTYADRVTAATLLRQQQEQQSRVTPQAISGTDPDLSTEFESQLSSGR